MDLSLLAETTIPSAASLLKKIHNFLDPGWNWLNEDPTAWSLAETPGWLRLALADFSYQMEYP